MGKRLAALGLAVVLDMAFERPSRSKLPELVADHVFGDEDRHVLTAVVHGDRVTEHGGHDHRPAGPGLDDILRAGLVLDVDLLHQVAVDERALLQTAWHVEIP